MIVRDAVQQAPGFTGGDCQWPFLCCANGRGMTWSLMCRLSLTPLTSSCSPIPTVRPASFSTCLAQRSFMTALDALL